MGFGWFYDGDSILDGISLGFLDGKSWDRSNGMGWCFSSRDLVGSE